MKKPNVTYGVPTINLDEFEIDPKVVKMIDGETARKLRAIPVNCAGRTLIAALAAPSNLFVIDELKFLTGMEVEVVEADERQIETAIAKYYFPN